ncbi:MAG TPA: hypothetical protein VIF09_14355 [Polyangiaceae bacterium]|jgi:hypothetical protein
MKPTLLRGLTVATLLGLLAASSTLGCTNGTTPVCDDAGSCLISSGDAGPSSSGDAGGAGDAPAE